MKQRLGFARLLLGRPELLVLDEPTNGLDPGEIREIRELIGRLTAQGATVLLSSHHLSEVEQVCSHLVVMNHGRLVRSGTVSELIGASGRSTSRSTIGSGPGPCWRDAGGRPTCSRRATGWWLTLRDGRRSDVAAALVGAGLRLETIMPTQRLEDAFLELLEAGDAARLRRRSGARRRRDRPRPHRVREGGAADADALVVGLAARRPADLDRRRHQRPRRPRRRGRQRRGAVPARPAERPAHPGRGA